jgi:hypothetical protein
MHSYSTSECSLSQTDEYIECDVSPPFSYLPFINSRHISAQKMLDVDVDVDADVL